MAKDKVKRDKLNVFMGPVKCPKCGEVSLRATTPVVKTNVALTVLSFIGPGHGYVSKRNVLYLYCPYCTEGWKVNGEYKERYKLCFKNEFDQEEVVDKFINDIIDELKNCGCMSANKVDDKKIVVAIKNIKKKYQAKQGFDDEFYEYMVKLVADESRVDDKFKFDF